VLPHSRIPFRLATAVTDIYGDNRSVDGYGLNADVLPMPGEILTRENLVTLAYRLLRD
jgi:hypothetical protein